MVKEGDVDAPFIVAVCHTEAVVLVAERRVVDEAVQDRIVFHFAKPDERGCVPFACGGNHFGNLLQFVVITAVVPIAIAVGEKVVVCGCWVVLRIK